MAYIAAVTRMAEQLGQTVEYNCTLDKYTTFKVGGKASAVIELSDTEAACKLFAEISRMKLPCFVLGKGSNVIADDNGFSGVILHVGNGMSQIFLDKSDPQRETVICGAGVSLNQLCRFALEHSLGGLEFAWGIPGTVGGAVYMNAGAYDGEIKDVIENCIAADKNGNTVKLSAEEMKLGYRSSMFENGDYLILSASFRLRKRDAGEIRARMDDLIARRKQRQPLEYPSAGSTFKRPKGSYASLLIEQCGLKGLSVGGAQVSTKHSGFIINTGNATSADILSLAELVRERVKAETGYLLELEPKLLSDNIK